MGWYWEEAAHKVWLSTPPRRIWLHKCKSNISGILVYLHGEENLLAKLLFWMKIVDNLNFTHKYPCKWFYMLYLFLLYESITPILTYSTVIQGSVAEIKALGKMLIALERHNDLNCNSYCFFYVQKNIFPSNKKWIDCRAIVSSSENVFGSIKIYAWSVNFDNESNS